MRFVRWKQRETETEREEGRDNQNKDCILKERRLDMTQKVSRKNEN